MNDVHEAAIAACDQELGDDLLSALSYSSTGDAYFQPGGGEQNLLLVVADDVDLDALRAIIGPLWPTPGETVCRPPFVATPTSLKRHLRLNPLLAHHLAHSGQRLAGKELLPAELAPEVHPTERAAYLASQAIDASAALAPDLLPPAQAEAAEQQLHRLATYLSGKEEETTCRCFAHVQRSVQVLTASLQGSWQLETTWEESGPVRAVYEETDHVVVVTPVLTADTLREMDWGAVDSRLRQPGMGLYVTTAEQLRLMLFLERPLHVALQRYQHLHGQDVLKGLMVHTRAVWRHAARTPSSLLIEEVPGAYLAAADDEARHMMIHDYQNGLLNMSLRHELLHRLHDFAPAEPPEPLPGRDEAIPVRVEAIRDHLAWWTQHYTREMLETPASDRLQAL